MYEYKHRLKKNTDIYTDTAHLLYLDIIPLLSSLQCLQVVTRRVVVHQFSSPFGNFLLQIEQDRRSGYICSVCICVYVWTTCVSLLVLVRLLSGLLSVCVFTFVYLLPLVLP